MVLLVPPKFLKPMGAFIRAQCTHIGLGGLKWPLAKLTKPIPFSFVRDKNKVKKIKG